jgi:hypothetical protein
LKQRLWLVKNGVPWDTAWAMDEIEAAAMAVTFGEIESGKSYNWTRNAYED